MTINTLATSSRYRIEHEYEAAYLCAAGGERVLIGDFYGDPEVALIDWNEKWCAVAGCGLIVYFIAAPFDEYECGKQSRQYFELKRQAPDIFWVREIRQMSDCQIELILEDGAKEIVSFSDRPRSAAD